MYSPLPARRPIFLFAAILLLCTLPGCGGGGSSALTPTPPPPVTCNATTITPYVTLGGGARTQVASATASSGTSVTLSPEPLTGGTWIWSGCGLSGSSREQTFTPTASCNATVLYTNGCGTTSSQVFAVTFNAVQSGYPNYNTSPAAPDASGMPSTATQLAAKFTLGWNIGNTLEAIGGETNWGNPMVSSQLMQLVKANGFTAVRIPASWDQYANQTTAAIGQAWLARVKQVVQYAVDNDLYVMVNVHWDGGWLERHIDAADQTAVNDKQRAYWQQIATTLRDFDEHVMFASANEPDADTAAEVAVLEDYHQTFVNAVRETGGRNAFRVLVVQGPQTNIDHSNTLWNRMPTDTVPNRLMAEVHFYAPWNFVGMTKDETWGNQAFYWGAPNHSATDPAHNPTWGEEAYVDDQFAIIKAKFVDRDIPVIVGEFASQLRGAPLTGDELSLHIKSRLYYHQYVVKSAVGHGLRPFFWDVGNAGGVFNRTNNTVSDPDGLRALQQGALGVAP